MAFNSHTLLIEVGTAEMPANILLDLQEQLCTQISKTLTQAHITYGEVNAYATPRRLAVLIQNVASTQANQKVQKRGPAVDVAFDTQGNPTAAALGFAKSCGVTIEDLTIQSSSQGRWLLFQQHIPGRKSKDLLSELLPVALNGFSLKKPMRWGNKAVTFIRPVQWLLALFGREVISFEAFGCQSDRLTYGHRFMQPQALRLVSADDYEEVLEKRGFVCADFSQRKAVIKAEIEQLADTMDCQIVYDEDLLNEVTGLVEWPVALFCSFERHLLRVPAEALMSSMQQHQKSFALKDQQGNLLPHFLIVSNLMSLDPEQIVKGNERVMHARLSDAAFFYDSDCNVTTEQRLQQLKQVTFQAKLGTLYDKAVRMASLSAYIATLVNYTESHSVERAAMLAKTDLVSAMVNEFPELQGIMGYYYAHGQGENDDVAVAIKEHYLPRFAEDRLPSTLLGMIIALADRVDNLVGLVGSRGIPSSDKDPFGLRRAALAILRILIDLNQRVDLAAIIEYSQSIYGMLIGDQVAAIIAFLEDRLLHIHKEQNMAVEIYQSLLAYYRASPKKTIIPDDFLQRARAVQSFCQQKPAEQLIIANKRVSNILQKNSQLTALSVNQGKLQETAEKNLYQCVTELEGPLVTHVALQQYDQALNLLVTLHQPLEHFFNDVMVECQQAELRRNRVALLLVVQKLLRSVTHMEFLQVFS